MLALLRLFALVTYRKREVVRFPRVRQAARVLTGNKEHEQFLKCLQVNCSSNSQIQEEEENGNSVAAESCCFPLSSCLQIQQQQSLPKAVLTGKLNLWGPGGMLPPRFTSGCSEQ